MMQIYRNFIALVATVCVVAQSFPSCCAFVLSPPLVRVPPQHEKPSFSVRPKSFREKHVGIHVVNQRRARTSVRLQGLFGLGAPELIVILIAGAFVIGPQGLASLAKSTGEITGGLKEEFKEIPQEFKKGVEEGEMEARSRNAKPMEQVPPASKDAEVE